MRIIGTGIDLADIERVGTVLAKYPRFAERCFTEHEREYAFRFAKPERRLAARFAGKEAVMKSMGTGWRRIRWRDIEITGGGKPTVRITGTRQGCDGVRHRVRGALEDASLQSSGNGKPPTSSLHSLTPPKGESVQKRTVGPIAQPDTLKGRVVFLTGYSFL